MNDSNPIKAYQPEKAFCRSKLLINLHGWFLNRKYLMTLFIQHEKTFGRRVTA